MNTTVKHMRAAFLTGAIALIALAFGLALSGCSCSEAPANAVGKLSVQANAEGYDAETSTPVEFVVYKGDVKEAVTDEDGSNDPEPLTAFTGDANESYTIVEATEQGAYTVRIAATPILADGTLFSIPDVAVVELGSDDSAYAVDLATIDMATASAEEVAEVTGQAADAAAASGDSAKAAAATAGISAAAGKAASSGNSAAASIAKQQASGISSAKPQPSQAQPSDPAHTHNWVAQTKTVHHDAEYKTVHHDAVKEKRYICNGCNGSFVSAKALGDHQKDALRNNIEPCNTAGSYVGSVTIQAARDEKVLVKDAWDETVTTGYKCSGCGATK